jgi:hypothetical protein
MVFNWYGATRSDPDGPKVPPAWAPVEWELWRAVLAGSAPPPTPVASPGCGSMPSDARHLPTTTIVPRPVATLLDPALRRPRRLVGPVRADRLGHVVAGLAAGMPPHCPLRPYLITLDVPGVPQDLWSCGTTPTPHLAPVHVAQALLLRIARRLSPECSGPAGVAPALIMWQVSWPECVHPQRVGGLLETLRSVGAAQLATHLLAEECGLTGVPSPALPEPEDLRELGWSADLTGVAGGYALGHDG